MRPDAGCWGSGERRRAGAWASAWAVSGLPRWEPLQGLARSLAQRLAPAVAAHEVRCRGYVPVFIDGSAVEVDGALFEGAGRGYDGTVQYWLHGVFIGGLWVSGRLHPGGVDVARGWRGQLERDVAPLAAGLRQIQLPPRLAAPRRLATSFPSLSGDLELNSLGSDQKIGPAAYNSMLSPRRGQSLPMHQTEWKP